MDNLITVVGKFFTKGNLGQSSILLAYSGGLDSTVLLDILIKIRNSHQLNISLVYYDHGVRQDTDADRQLIRDYAKQYKLEYYIGLNSITGYQSEDNLRKKRYCFLNKIAKHNGSDFIALAHHLDDNLETIIQRIIRGTSVWGLQGISQQREKFIRPLMMISKKEILSYARQNNLVWREDATNSDLNITRNLIRSILSSQHKAIMLSSLESLPDLKNLNNQIEILLKPYLNKHLILDTEFTKLSLELRKELIYRFIRFHGYSKQIPNRILKLIEIMLSPVDESHNLSRHFNQKFKLKTIELDKYCCLKIKSQHSQIFLTFERK